MDSQSEYQEAAAIAEQIGAAGATLGKQQIDGRGQLLDLAYRLIASLEMPSEAIMRMMWAEPSRTALCKLAIDLKLFEHLKESGSKGTSDGELAKACGADPTLLARTMKHLAAMHMVKETSGGHYISTSLSDSLTEPRYRDGVLYLYDVARPAFQLLPGYLEKTSYRNPTDLHDGPFQFAHGTKLPFFEWLQENTKQGERFNNYMAGYRAGRPHWIDASFCPLAEKLASTFNSSHSPVMLVDLGGGLGHDLVDLKKKHPQLPGELILQDLESVISTVPGAGDGKLPFKVMAHDFFETQPIKKARAYHFHSSLHGWDDENCVNVLKNVARAMKPGYSSVLIFEMVVPVQGAPWPVTSEDLLMAALGAKHERTLAEWESIIHRAGLKICKVWSAAMGSESLIEAELVE